MGFFLANFCTICYLEEGQCRGGGLCLRDKWGNQETKGAAGYQNIALKRPWLGAGDTGRIKLRHRDSNIVEHEKAGESDSEVQRREARCLEYTREEEETDDEEAERRRGMMRQRAPERKLRRWK